MSPSLTVCAIPGCPTLTAGNYCPDHAVMTPDEEHAHLVERNRRIEHYHALRRRAQRLRDDVLPGDSPEFTALRARAAAKAEQSAERARLHITEPPEDKP